MIADEKVRVRFLTPDEEYRITDAPISLPSTLGRAQLSEVVNHLLDKAEDPVTFDFMIMEHLIRLPLQKFLAIYQISTENVIEIVYFPATTMEESNETEMSGWIGSIDTSLGNVVISGCYDGLVQFNNSSDLSKINEFKAHEDPIRSVVCWSSSSSNGNSDKKSKSKTSSGPTFLATASKDQTVKCWDITNTSNIQHIATLTGHINSVEAVATCRPVAQPNDVVLLSGDWTGTVFGWNMNKLGDISAESNNDDSQDKKKRKKGVDASTSSAVGVNITLKPLFTIKAHSQAISGLCGSRVNGGKNNSLFTSSWDHAIKEWDLERQDCLNTFASSKVVTSIDCSSDVNSTMLLASSHPDGKVRCWDARMSKEASTAKVSLGKHNHWISQVKWRPNSAQIFAATDYDGNIALWDIRSNIPLGHGEAHSGKALSVNWLTGNAHPDSMDTDNTSASYSIVSGGSDCNLKVSHVKN